MLLAFVVFDTVLCLPILMIIMCQVFHGLSTENKEEDLIKLGMSLACLLVYSCFTIFFKRIYHLRLENDKIPWAALDHKDNIIKYGTKIACAVYYSISLMHSGFMT